MSEPARSFPLAPMCGLIRWLTVGLLMAVPPLGILYGGNVEFYISRVDGLVVVDRPFGKALLITPSDPAAFVRAVVA